MPADEQFGVLAELQAAGKVAAVGLSEVGVDQIEQARLVVDVATVQNRYNITDRSSDDVLRYCTEQGIGFIPWAPIAAGRLAEPGSVLDAAARRLGATAAQVALAWLLQRSSVMLPIPGTSSVGHLEENVRAAGPGAGPRHGRGARHRRLTIGDLRGRRSVAEIVIGGSTRYDGWNDTRVIDVRARKRWTERLASRHSPLSRAARTWADRPNPARGCSREPVERSRRRRPTVRHRCADRRPSGYGRCTNTQQSGARRLIHPNERNRLVLL